VDMFKELIVDDPSLGREKTKENETLIQYLDDSTKY
jgi:hypothetical protein